MIISWCHPSSHTVPFMIFGVVGLRALTSQQQMNVQCITKIELFLTNHISVEVRDHLGLLWGCTAIKFCPTWRVERVEHQHHEDVTIFTLRIFCADFCLSWCISGCQVGTDVKFLWNANCVAPSGCPPVKSKVVAKVYAIMYFFLALFTWIIRIRFMKCNVCSIKFLSSSQVKGCGHISAIILFQHFSFGSAEFLDEIVQSKEVTSGHPSAVMSCFYICLV